MVILPAVLACCGACSPAVAQRNAESYRSNANIAFNMVKTLQSEVPGTTMYIGHDGNLDALARIFGKSPDDGTRLGPVARALA